MEFENKAQKACYKRVTRWMKELFGGFSLTRKDAPGFAVVVGSAIAHVMVLPWEEGGAVVTTRAYVTSGSRLDAKLMRFLLLRNTHVLFGAFGIEDHGDIVFDHTIVGQSCDKEELRASVLTVVLCADRYDDEIVRRWGGERALDRGQ